MVGEYLKNTLLIFQNNILSVQPFFKVDLKKIHGASDWLARPPPRTNGGVVQ
jgi:hypothetical protein